MRYKITPRARERGREHSTGIVRQLHPYKARKAQRNCSDAPSLARTSREKSCASRWRMWSAREAPRRTGSLAKPAGTRPLRSLMHLIMTDGGASEIEKGGAAPRAGGGRAPSRGDALPARGNVNRGRNSESGVRAARAVDTVNKTGGAPLAAVQAGDRRPYTLPVTRIASAPGFSAACTVGLGRFSTWGWGVRESALGRGFSVSFRGFRGE